MTLQRHSSGEEWLQRKTAASRSGGMATGEEGGVFTGETTQSTVLPRQKKSPEEKPVLSSGPITFLIKFLFVACKATVYIFVQFQDW